MLVVLDHGHCDHDLVPDTRLGFKVQGLFLWVVLKIMGPFWSQVMSRHLFN